MKPRLLALFFVASLSLVARGQAPSPCADFEKLVKDTYHFKPSRLAEAERTRASAAMDRIWDNAKANPAALPCLSSLLSEKTADLFFLFDGSNLLVTLAKSHDAKAIQVDSYSRVDLEDVDLRLWVETLARRGLEGFDVSSAGSLWLSYPKASYFLPEHGAYNIKKFEGALFIFGSMEESQATPALLRIATGQKHPGRDVAVQYL